MNVPYRNYCEALEREHWMLLPCDKAAAVVYVDADGVHHGFCPKHRAAGIVQASYKGWTIAVPETVTA